MSLREILQELRELGAGGAAWRVGREVRLRAGLEARLTPRVPDFERRFPRAPAPRVALPFGAPRAVADALGAHVAPDASARLGALARDAARGRVLCFSRWSADYGAPIDWHLNPATGQRWRADAHWSMAIRDERRVGDVKLTWEVARFPQAYHLARAAAFGEGDAPALAAVLHAQVEGFARANPFPLGVHWASGQEVAFRVMAWCYALHVFAGLGVDVTATARAVARQAWLAGHHLEHQLEYARRAVYNNHLLSEALGLWLCARLVPPSPEAARWTAEGLATLDAQADRQFYEDGGYIQQSHTYHRVALQDYLWAWSLRRAEGRAPPRWRRALARSLDFLAAQQNPGDGRLPNYGANDGALPSVLSTCAYGDFRPTLQAVSVAARGERVYPPGPWDEEAAWFLGVEALDAPLRPPPRRSVSLAATGQHALRGDDGGTFATLRCGALRDRFTQIDMLHLDVWWRGENVLADGGSYLYNGPAAWYDHFFRTASHNTVTVDGRDQMLHHRRFKVLYPTRARLVRFEAGERVALCEGEHEGYARHPGRCVHRRTVLFARDDLWVVVDAVEGDGAHDARLHWLCTDAPSDYAPREGRLTLATPAGEFSVLTLDARGAALAGDVVRGREDPPRGWLARHYGEKTPAPSLAVSVRAEAPIVLVSVLGAGRPEVVVEGARWRARAGASEARFALRDGVVTAD